MFTTTQASTAFSVFIIIFLDCFKLLPVLPHWSKTDVLHISGKCVKQLVFCCSEAAFGMLSTRICISIKW